MKSLGCLDRKASTTRLEMNLNTSLLLGQEYDLIKIKFNNQHYKLRKLCEWFSIVIPIKCPSQLSPCYVVPALLPDSPPACVIDDLNEVMKCSFFRVSPLDNYHWGPQLVIALLSSFQKVTWCKFPNAWRHFILWNSGFAFKHSRFFVRVYLEEGAMGGSEPVDLTGLIRIDLMGRYADRNLLSRVMRVVAMKYVKETLEDIFGSVQGDLQFLPEVVNCSLQ